VLSLAAVSDCVFAGGSFTTADGQNEVAGVPVLNAARWCFDKATGVSEWLPVDWAKKEAGTCFAIVNV